jgi:hypothetical protein
MLDAIKILSFNTVKFLVKEAKMKKNDFLMGILSVVLIFGLALFVGCNADLVVTRNNTRATLTPVLGVVSVAAADTMTNVTFTGATSLSLSKTDFAVTSGGTITVASVASGTAMVTVTFPVNMSTTAKTYTVSIASTSTKMKGNGTVTINQAAAVPDTRATLAPGSAVEVGETDATANVAFTGATGLTLSTADFAVTSGGAISSVSVASDTATVTIIFPVNRSTTAKTYTVSIASDSTVIKGDGTVTINQAAAASDTRVTLTPGSAVAAVATATSANVSFTGATGLTLSTADFAVTSGGAISSVRVASGTATVTVTFAAYPTTAKTYTVSITPDSAVIKGDGTVAINQAAAASDTRTTLTPGSAVAVAASATTANVIFTGATGLTLSTIDFAVTSAVTSGTGFVVISHGTISSVSVASGTATVTVDFPTNTSFTVSNTYTVSIASDSLVIKGYGTVAINQAAVPDTRATLTPGSAVEVGETDITANVAFTGATGLTLSTIDFAVDNGATITNVNRASGTATVNVTFAASPTTSKTYTVSIASNSTKIKGNGTVAINQFARSTLTPGPAVEIPGSATTSSVTFTGATGLTLTAADFAVDNDATITNVNRVSDTATVNVTFAANTSGITSNIYTVSIASDSAVIKGNGTVAINQVPLLSWTAITSTFGTASIRGVAYGGGKFIAVGDNGMAYSSDGETWTAITSTFGTSNGVTYGGGKFVAVGASGKMAYSSDGVSWRAVNATQSTFGSSTTINGVAYGGGKFVAVGNGMAYSNPQE